jgi:hypothetical protein
MRKALYIALVASLVVMVYAGCKNKTKPVDVPVSIFRITYSDEDVSSDVNAGDLIIIQFDRHVTLSPSATDPAAVFEFFDGADSFGTGATLNMEQTSGHAITVTLGDTPVFIVNGEGFIGTQIRIHEDITPGALKDWAWNTNVIGGGAYKSIEGRTGTAAVRIDSAIYEDVDTSGTVTAGDTITVTFTGNVTVNYWNDYWPGWTFIIPVNRDYFGDSAKADYSTGLDTIVITIGTGATLEIPGVHDVGTYAPDSASGLDIKIMLANGFLTYDADGTPVNVPPDVVDIEPVP